MISVVDLKIGNVASVVNMLGRLNESANVISKPEQIKTSKVIIPGVGHFDEGVRRMRSTGLAEAVISLVKDDAVQILGICLGMQLLCQTSEEGHLRGLGLIDADVRKFRFSSESKLKVPHMGWNVVSASLANPLLPVGAEEQRFYFVHSYKVVPDDPEVTIATANYGGEFCAAFQQGNVFGVQFHPEKSHRFGLDLMRRFVEL